MKESTFSAYRGYPMHLYVWDDVPAPKGVVQLVHGMCEHLGRYDEFARFLNEAGYIVLGDDHRGHGKTCADKPLGVVPDGDCFEDTVQDEILITAYAKQMWGLPVVLFGHSYGSFLSQRYIQLNSSEIVACVLCGSAKQDTPDVDLGKRVATMQTALFGKDKPAKMIRKLSFGDYDKQFTDREVGFAWGNRDPEERKKYLADPLCDQTMSLGFYKSFFTALKNLYREDRLAGVRKDLPIYIVSGDKDPVGGSGKLVTRLYEMYKELGADKAEIKLYPDARHELLNELNKREVYADVLEFIIKSNR